MRHADSTSDASPGPPAPPGKRNSWMPIAMVGFIGLALTVTLSFLTLNFFTPVLFISVAFFGLVGFHYLVWGWWVQRIVAEEAGLGEDE